MSLIIVTNILSYFLGHVIIFGFGFLPAQVAYYFLGQVLVYVFIDGADFVVHVVILDFGVVVIDALLAGVNY